MNAWLVFAAFAVVAGIWTVAWIWIVTHAHSAAPTKAGEEFDLAGARRILLPLLGAAAIAVFVTGRGSTSRCALTTSKKPRL